MRATIKTKVKSYFKYHHYNTHPAKDSHTGYIRSLEGLEGLSDTTLADSGDIDKSWEEIKQAIKSLNENQIETLYFAIQNNKNE